MHNFAVFEAVREKTCYNLKQFDMEEHNINASTVVEQFNYENQNQENKNHIGKQPKKQKTIAKVVIPKNKKIESTENATIEQTTNLNNNNLESNINTDDKKLKDLNSSKTKVIMSKLKFFFKINRQFNFKIESKESFSVNSVILSQPSSVFKFLKKDNFNLGLLSKSNVKKLKKLSKYFDKNQKKFLSLQAKNVLFENKS